MLSFDDLPVAVDHYPIDWQGESGKHQRVQYGIGTVAAQHRIVVVEHQKVGRRAFSQQAMRSTAGRGPALTNKLEQIAAAVAFADGSDISALRREPEPWWITVNTSLASISTRRWSSVSIKSCPARIS